MADPVAAGSMQVAMPNVQLAQEGGVPVQKEAMETQVKAMVRLIDSMGGNDAQVATQASDGSVGGQINTYA